MYRVAFIGTGSSPENPGSHGYAMAYQHARGYAELENCKMVACCDLVIENAEKFAEHFGIEQFYTDYRKMLEEEEPDIVSICTWPNNHAELVLGCLPFGVKAIHCEKPMARNWEECREMTEACEQEGVRLTFNHQRRFGAPFRKAKALLDAGEVGELRRVEFSAGNLYDYGSHSFDMCGYFNDELPADWVIAQIDYREENLVFGAHNENQAFALWEYENGVYGQASTGRGAGLIDCHNRIVGSDGVIEIGASDAPVLRYRKWSSKDWEAVDCGDEGCHGPGYVERAIADIVAALEKGRHSELCARNALKGTEIIFSCWESSRSRRRVDLPLKIEGNPLEEMVEAGELNPE